MATIICLCNLITHQKPPFTPHIIKNIYRRTIHKRNATVLKQQNASAMKTYLVTKKLRPIAFLQIRYTNDTLNAPEQSAFTLPFIQFSITLPEIGISPTSRCTCTQYCYMATSHTPPTLYTVQTILLLRRKSTSFLQS